MVVGAAELGAGGVGRGIGSGRGGESIRVEGGLALVAPKRERSNKGRKRRCVRAGKATPLEMNGTGESKPILGRCNKIRRGSDARYSIPSFCIKGVNPYPRT